MAERLDPGIRAQKATYAKVLETAKKTETTRRTSEEKELADLYAKLRKLELEAGRAPALPAETLTDISELSSAGVDLAALAKIRDEAILQFDITALLSKWLTGAAAATTAWGAFPKYRSPITLEEAKAEAEKWEKEANDQFLVAQAALIVAEAASLGQLDVNIAGLMNYPSWRAWIGGVERLAGIKIEAGVRPYLERYWRKQTQPMIPAYADMISIAVREGWMKEKWVEIPKDWLEWMKELGYEEKWSKMLWGKHWILPSVGDLYEMLHRRLIPAEKLAYMLKMHDIEPEWRPYLEAISYRVLRLVDMRSGWELGILSDVDLRNALMDYGYDPKVVDKVAAVHKAIALSAEIGTLRKEYMKWWEDDLITEAEYDKHIADLKTLRPREWYFKEQVRLKKLRKAREAELKEAAKAAMEKRLAELLKLYQEPGHTAGEYSRWEAEIKELETALKVPKAARFKFD